MDPATTSGLAIAPACLADLVSARIAFGALGAAYLLLLANAVFALTLYAASRVYLVVTPNRGARHYGLYVAAVLLTLIVAIGLENELVPGRASLLGYAALPHLLALLLIHIGVYRSPEPRLISLGAASTAGLVLAAAGAAIGGVELATAHWVTVGLLVALLGLLWRRSVSTQRGFLEARSIYLASKEKDEPPLPAAETPWPGAGQWIALTVASLALAALNAVLRGAGLAEVPALGLVLEAALLLGLTSLVCTIPAAGYWWLHRQGLPELPRLAWLVWLIVAFAFTYRNYLTQIGP